MTRLIDSKPATEWPPPCPPPAHLRAAFEGPDGTMPITRDYCLSQRYEGHQVINWTAAFIDDYRAELAARRSPGTYEMPDLDKVRAELARLDLTGRSALVIGTEKPWVEALLLNAGAESVWVFEYSSIVSEHPRLHAKGCRAMAQDVLDGAGVAVDLVASYSSLEHSGLGRYGDALNPDGDVEAMAQAWCMLKPGGLAMIAVPMTCTDAGHVEFNAHRVYGLRRLAHISTLFEFAGFGSQGCGGDATGQPIAYFRKPLSGQPAVRTWYPEIASAAQAPPVASPLWLPLQGEAAVAPAAEPPVPVHAPANAPAACARYVCVDTHPNAGLGHRLTNLAQGMLVSAALGIPLAAPIALEVPGEGPASHGGYAGANDLFRVDSPVSCPRDEQWGGLPTAESRMVVIPDELRDTPDAWRASAAVGGSMQACGDAYTTYVVREFWPSKYESVRPQLRAMYRPQSAVGRALHAALLFNASRFSVAVHSRAGDIQPTPPEYSGLALQAVLRELAPLRVPVDVWAFSDGSIAAGSALHSALTAALAAVPSDALLHVDTSTLPVLAVFTHFVESDAFISCDSSLSWMAAWIATTPVVLMAPNIRGSGPGYGTARMDGMIPVAPSGVISDVQPLRRAAEAWLARNGAQPRVSTASR